MKYEYVESCADQSISIDGKDFSELSNEELKKSLIHLIETCEDSRILFSAMADFIESAGTYLGDTQLSSYPCEYCGEYTTTYSLEI